MTATVEVLGIRHHGPGSARSVARALDELRPDVVLIEGAPELDRVVELLADTDMRPPVAGLVYAVDAPRKALFYPLASFSPEWVAARWALDHGVPVRFADLPVVHQLRRRARGRGGGVPTRSGAPPRPDRAARLGGRLRRPRAVVGGRHRAPQHLVAGALRRGQGRDGRGP